MAATVSLPIFSTFTGSGFSSTLCKRSSTAAGAILVVVVLTWCAVSGERVNEPTLVSTGSSVLVHHPRTQESTGDILRDVTALSFIGDSHDQGGPLPGPRPLVRHGRQTTGADRGSTRAAVGRVPRGRRRHTPGSRARSRHTLTVPSTAANTHLSSPARNAIRKDKKFASRKGKHRVGNKGRKSATMVWRKVTAPPKFMLDLYHTYRNGLRAQPAASVVRAFTHTNKGTLNEGNTRLTWTRRLRFNLSSLPTEESLSGAELRIHLTIGRERRPAPNSVRVCVLLLLPADAGGGSGGGGGRELDCRSRQGGRLAWESLNVREAVAYWRRRREVRHELEVRLESFPGDGAGRRPPGGKAEDGQRSQEEPPPLDPRVLDTGGVGSRGSPADLARPRRHRLDIVTSRSALRPLLVVYSEEPPAPEEPPPDDAEREEDGSLPTAAVTTFERNNSARLKTKHKTARQTRSLGGGTDAAGSDRLHIPYEETNSAADPRIKNDTFPTGKWRRQRWDRLNMLHTRRGVRSASGREQVKGGKRRLKRGKSRRRSRRQCRRLPMYVNFADINWHKWVIAPKGYEAYQCSGRCDFPLSDHLTPTKHAIVQSLMHINKPERAARACCVPTRLDPISILYVDERNVVTYKYRYQGMMVGQCGCR